MPFFYAGLSFLICLVATPAVKAVARKKGWLAYPSKDRWHQTPTALFGGIAIYLGIALPLLFTADFSSLFPHLISDQTPASPPSASAVLLIGMSFLFVLGLVDDFKQIKPQTKLVGQILVASMVTFLRFRLNWFESLTLDTVVTIVWIVGITNAVNLIDNMDGLCAGVSLVAALFLSIVLTPAQPGAALAAMMLAGSLAAFLIFNFNPASIFMGDCGSLVIGFALGLLALLCNTGRAVDPLAAYAVPILVLMVPIFDTTMVTLIRTLSGRKASTGGKDHTSHRLVLMGLSQKKAVLFLYGIGITAGTAAWFVDRSDSYTSPAVLIPGALALLLMGIYLAQLRVYPEKEFSVLRDRAYTPVLMELTYKRQLLLVILDFWLIAFVYYLSYRIRFIPPDFSYYFKIFLRSLPAVIACKFIAFFTMGIYRGIWRYISFDDLLTCLKASVLGSVLCIAAVTYIFRFEDFSKGIFLIDFLLTTGFLFATRGSFRLFFDTMTRRTNVGENVLIYGAGRGGELLLREIVNNKDLKLKPVGFIDDDKLKTGRKLQGYPVLGTPADLTAILDKTPITGVLISFSTCLPPADRLDQVRRFCRDKDLFLKRFSIKLEEVDLEG